MHKIYFYKDKNGNEPIADYLAELASKPDKDSRIKFNKLRDYVKALSEYGLLLKEPYIKHIDGEIWELRPIRERVFFAAWINGSFVLLHHFTKKSRKTPKKEIEQAKRNLADLMERGLKNG